MKTQNYFISKAWKVKYNSKITAGEKKKTKKKTG